MTSFPASPAAIHVRPGVPEDPPSLPWRRTDLHQVITLATLGAIVMLTGYEGVSQTDDFDTQLLWIVVGAAGLILAGLGAGLWLTAGFRNVRARMLALPEETARRLAVLVPQTDAVAAPAGAFVTADTMTRWHRADCPLVRGKSGLQAVDPARTAGRERCGVCAP